MTLTDDKNVRDLDDFDKLILVQLWFQRWNPTQRNNILKILEKITNG